MIMSAKQRKLKTELRIKLNHNVYNHRDAMVIINSDSTSLINDGLQFYHIFGKKNLRFAAKNFERRNLRSSRILASLPYSRTRALAFLT